jgi:hypothetical protein
MENVNGKSVASLARRFVAARGRAVRPQERPTTALTSSQSTECEESTIREGGEDHTPSVQMIHRAHMLALTES